MLNLDDSFVSRIRDRVGPAWPCTTSGSTPRSPTGCPSSRSRTCGSTTTSCRRWPGPDDGLLKPSDERTFEVLFGDGGAGIGTVGPLELQQRGLAAMINATAATATARMLLGDAFDPAPRRGLCVQ